VVDIIVGHFVVALYWLGNVCPLPLKTGFHVRSLATLRISHIGACRMRHHEVKKRSKHIDLPGRYLSIIRKKPCLKKILNPRERTS
jgi:hypothetical protein